LGTAEPAGEGHLVNGLLGHADDLGGFGQGDKVGYVPVARWVGHSVNGICPGL
jgi:hypothetical protein